MPKYATCKTDNEKEELPQLCTEPDDQILFFSGITQTLIPSSVCDAETLGSFIYFFFLERIIGVIFILRI